MESKLTIKGPTGAITGACDAEGCSCEAGYKNDDKNGCIDINIPDIDECLSGSHDCNHPAPCNSPDGHGKRCTEAPWESPCREVTNDVTLTNRWTCRDCFNLRVNFNLKQYRDNWGNKMYMTFTNNITVVKFAGPMQSMVLDRQMDNGHFKFDLSFGNHEFGDGQIDFNAEYRLLGKDSELANAWICPTRYVECDPGTNPFKITGGKWKCTSKAKPNAGQPNAMVIVCRAICDSGNIPKNGFARARCQTFSTKKQSTPGHWYWPNNRPSDDVTCT